MPNESLENLVPAETVEGNLRSEAMNEIISRKAGFLSQWGLFIFLGILALLFMVAWYIQYPDVIMARATVVATNAPKEIIVKQDGRLTKLFVKNNDSIKAQGVVAYIESSANHEQVLLLGSSIDTTIQDLKSNRTDFIVKRFAANFDSLGELQQGYQQFISTYQQFSDYLKDGFYLKRKRVLDDDLLLLQKNLKIIHQQRVLLLKDLSLSEENYKANEALLKDKVISKQDDRNEQSKLLTKQLSIPQIDASLLNNETAERAKQKEITDLEHSISQQKIIFLQAVHTFQSQVVEWIKKYVVLSPISGKVNFIIPFQENQYLTAGKLLGYVSPPDSKYYVEVNLPQNNFGKIKTGQTVQLRFDAYPYQEFGYVKGKLVYITDFATDSGFLAHIDLPSGLLTNQNKNLHYHDGLKAEAQIITNDMRLLERFYKNIISSVDRKNN